MVALLKFIISTALLSLVSAAAIPADSSLVNNAPSADTSNVLPAEIEGNTIFGRVVVDEPVLFSEPAPAAIATPTLKVRAEVSQIVEATGALGLLVVGEPVLAIRSKVLPVSTSVHVRDLAATSTTTLLSVQATGVLGDLIVGDPVLAVRPVSVVKTTTLITSVLKSTPTPIV